MAAPIATEFEAEELAGWPQLQVHGGSGIGQSLVEEKHFRARQAEEAAERLAVDGASSRDMLMSRSTFSADGLRLRAQETCGIL